MEIIIKDNQLEDINGMTPAYPYVFHDVNLRGTKVPWHWHEELELGYVKEGTVQVVTPNKKYEFAANEAFFINSNVLCTMMRENGEVCGRLESHLFHPVLLGGHFKSIFSTKYLEPVLQNKELELLEFRDNSQNQREILSKLKQLSKLQKEEDTELQTRNVLSDIWLLLLVEIQHIKKGKYSGGLIYKERVQTMMSFIRQNYMNKLYLEEIAASASVSKRECLRCFQKSLGKTPYDYLMDVRIDMAQKYLQESNIPIAEVAFRTGFSGSAYFGKVFKEMCGMAPGEYRKLI